VRVGVCVCLYVGSETQIHQKIYKGNETYKYDKTPEWAKTDAYTRNETLFLAREHPVLKLSCVCVCVCMCLYMRVSVLTRSQ